MTTPLRIAIVSTPRSGNMWLRRLLVESFALEERSGHAPDEIAWELLPARCVVQLHWPRTRAFRRQLAGAGFRVVAIARHPLDVLLSILHFAAHEPETERWLDGLGGGERELLGLDPVSPAFRAYATGPRGRALLDVSRRWWEHAAHALRYEDLVADPAGELTRLAHALGVEPEVAPADAVARVTFARLAAEAQNRHFWQGRPGHWRELLPGPLAAELAKPYRRQLRLYGYAVEPDPELAVETARERWRLLVGAAS